MTARPRAVQHVLAVIDVLARAMAYAAGAAFVLLAVYMTVDVTGRKFFGISSAITDEVGGYALAFGGMWALAWTLRSGGHVRIDVLLPYLPARMQSALGYASLAIMAVFAGAVAIYTWQLAIDSWLTDTRATSFVRTPLCVPQGLMAIGVSVLALEAVVLLGCGLAASVQAGRLVTPPVLKGDETAEPMSAGGASWGS
jgi:TRAP-type C4-dicarboxylate transport system permease small subunit